VLLKITCVLDQLQVLWLSTLWFYILHANCLGNKSTQLLFWDMAVIGNEFSNNHKSNDTWTLFLEKHVIISIAFLYYFMILGRKPSTYYYGQYHIEETKILRSCMVKCLSLWLLIYPLTRHSGFTISCIQDP
jgi:hypothetical protein